MDAHTFKSREVHRGSKAFSMHLDETFNKRSLMQISMNQGPGLSEWNWLTEGCHPCAWKMMDRICKLLCPSALYLFCHWLLGKVEILQLLEIQSSLVKFPLFEPFCWKRFHMISTMAGLIIIVMSFVFSSSSLKCLWTSDKCKCERRKKKNAQVGHLQY